MGAVPIKISIVVISHNKPNYVKKALDSVFNQTYPYWQAVVMDSGSLLDRNFFADYTDPRFEFYYTNETDEIKRTKHMPSWVQNETHDRGLVKGDLIMYLCDDDIIYPRCFETFVTFFENNPGIFAAYASQDVIEKYSDGSSKIVKERIADMVRGACIKSIKEICCQVDYLQFCYRKEVLNIFPNPNRPFSESKNDSGHADGLMMSYIGRFIPIYPINVKVSANCRTPDSQFVGKTE